uniref:Link domain-containing protein n=1 Tax=viral metagenome TaxID=1070528 RepID=A0A6C0ASS0_9ZZZZ
MIAYFVLGFVFNSSSSGLSTIIDFCIFGALLLFILIQYYTTTPDQQQKYFTNAYNWLIGVINNPAAIIADVVFLVALYLVVYLVRIPMDGSKPISVSFIESSAWILLVVMIINDFFKYVLKIDLTDMLSQMWKTTSKQIDISGNPISAVTSNIANVTKNIDGNEVFNVSNNLYTYDDAQAICTSYGAKLATYDQIEQAYNNGGEWCNYGWSDGQMILFPTQKSTWQKLQKNAKHKNDCGRPGINGGFIDNPYMKFGVNCYGKKPPPTADDMNRLSAKQNQVTPMSDEDLALQSKVDYWKKNSSKLLQLNSYNTKKWSSVS